MNKIQISEERLNQLIYESLAEVIEESWVGDKWNNLKSGVSNAYQNFKQNGGMAGALGRAYQGVRNGIANAKKDFEFGRAAARARNVDYDPLKGYVEKYGPEFAQKMVDNLGSKYGEKKKNKMTNVRQGKTIPMTDEPMVIPDLQQAQNGEQPLQNGGQQGQGQNGGQQGKTGQQQGQGGNGQNVQNKAQGLVKKYSTFLKQKGFDLVNGQWVYTKDGSNSPALQSQYPDILKAANGYNVAMRGAKKLYEEKIREAVKNSLKEYLNEVGDTLKGQYMLGRLDANRHKKAKDLNEPIHTLQKQHDFEKSRELRNKQYDLYDRSRHAFMKAHDERLDGPIPMLPSDPKRKMMQMSNDIGQDIERLRLKLQDIKKKNADRKNGAQEELNEVGDTWKGQEKLGRLMAKREKQSGDEMRKAKKATDPNEIEKHNKKSNDYLRRSTAAYVKGEDERDKKYNSWTKAGQMMNNAFDGGYKKEYKKRK